MATLLILKGANQGQRVPLVDDEFVLGRNPDCHVVIPGSAVSRRHAFIRRAQDKYFIEDTESRNGTFVNNQQITGRTQLKDNDRIKICDFLCTFHETPQPKPLPKDLQPEEPDEEDPAGSSTLEASVGRQSSHQILELQPAEKLKTLLEISTSLAKTLELDTLLPRIADNLFTLFRQADRCFLILREDNDKLVPKLIKTRRAQHETNARFSRSIVRNCLETVQALLSEDATTDSRFGLAQSIADFRIRSVMCVPLCTADGKGFGVIQLDTQDRTKKFTRDDLSMLLLVANQAAVALSNAKLHQNLLARERFQRDLELGREVQRGFLPRGLPEVPNYDFFTHYEAALQVGGDYYDFIPLPDGRLVILLGDVAGKGVPAALLMAKLSAEARFCILTESDPATAVSRLNGLLNQAGLMDRFVTLVVAVVDPTTHIITFVNAGHLTPLVYRAATGKLEDAVSNDLSGLPLGVFDGFEYAADKVTLNPGDSLHLFTDGVTDALNTQNQPFLLKGIHAAFAEDQATEVEGGITPTILGERLVKAVRHHSAGQPQHDDIALVCFGRLFSGRQSATIKLPKIGRD